MRDTESLQHRLDAFGWRDLAQSLDENGYAVLPRLLSPAACADIAGMYDAADAQRFRRRVGMARHGFGRGEYRYFAYPLPDAVQRLRTAAYPHLVDIANRWHADLRLPTRFPSAHADYLDRCHADGQTQPTPLLLRYGAGDYNCLHQDLYGEHVFPLQLAVLLSRPGEDFDGGEFVLTEQRPRRQSRAEVVALRQGDGVVFPVNDRPVRGVRGRYRAKLRHGVSCVRAGRRHALGIIFHDAR